MDLRVRLLVAAAIGVGAAAFHVHKKGEVGYAAHTDFSWSLHAGRELLAGRDVYAEPSAAAMIPYPLPAAMIGAGLAWLPMWAASGAFVGVSSALLAFGLTREGEWWRLGTFLSTPFRMAAIFPQWSPLMMAALLLPWLAPALLAKPQFLLPFLPRLRRWHVGAWVGLGLGSLALDATWPVRWIARLGPFIGFVPALTCPLLLVAALRWRDEKARLFLLIACMPQQVFLYDALLLWLVPRTARGVIWLTSLSLIAVFLLPEVGNFIEHGAEVEIALLYIPALVIVLWQADGPGAGGLGVDADLERIASPAVGPRPPGIGRILRPAEVPVTSPRRAGRPGTSRGSRPR